MAAASSTSGSGQSVSIKLAYGSGNLYRMMAYYLGIYYTLNWRMICENMYLSGILSGN